MFRNFVQYILKREKVMLGRWSLKHNCPTEALTVFNANRDHCGDTICGKPIKYEEQKHSRDNPCKERKNSA